MEKPLRILFLGNSHTYMNDIPALFAHIYEKTTGRTAEAVMLAYSGRDLEWHMNEYPSLRYNLLYGHYDYCVIQQAAHPFPPEETTLKYGTQIIDLCRKADTVPVLSMTWAEKAHPENQQKMIDTYTKLAEMTGALLAPAGKVWQEIREKDPEIELYYRDGEHASPYGDLLIAMVLVRTLTGAVPALPDFILDYQVEFPEDGRFPHACEDVLSVRIPYDRKQAEILQEAASRQ